VTHDSPEPLIIPAGIWGFEMLHVTSGADVVLQGPSTIVVGRLLVNSNGGLSFDTTAGEISLTVTEELALSEGSAVSTSSPYPAEVGLQVADTVTGAVDLGATTHFYGIVYAPEAEVVISGDFELFGAVVCNQLELVGPAKLHFDCGLQELARLAALPSFLSWRILDLSNETNGLITNPFLIDGIDENACPSPADAHADQILETTYVDHDGATASYEGWESDFDWTDVAFVLDLWRDGEEVVYFPEDPPEPPPTTSDLAAKFGLPEPVSSGDLMTALLNASPLDTDLVQAAIDDPILETGDLKTVLLENTPLELSEHKDLLYRDPPMESDDLGVVLIACSPLPTGLLDEYEAFGLLDPDDLEAVKDHQGEGHDD